jgi:hypothetical protein
MPIPKQKQRSALEIQIREALKNRQNVELRGKSISVKKLLNEMIVPTYGKAMIPELHEEDYAIRVIENIGFPPSDKIIIEGVMKQVLQEFGWPSVRILGHVQFYFNKLLKELYHDRIIPVFLFEHPEILKAKAFRIIEILSTYTTERKIVGIPSIMCITEKGIPVSSLQSSSLVIQLEADLTKMEVRELIEEIAPGLSDSFTSEVIKEIERLPSMPEITTKIKDLIRYMRKLGLEKIDSELYQELAIDRKKRRTYATSNH